MTLLSRTNRSYITTFSTMAKSLLLALDMRNTKKQWNALGSDRLVEPIEDVMDDILEAIAEGAPDEPEFDLSSGGPFAPLDAPPLPAPKAAAHPHAGAAASSSSHLPLPAAPPALVHAAAASPGVCPPSAPSSSSASSDSSSESSGGFDLSGFSAGWHKLSCGTNVKHDVYKPKNTPTYRRWIAQCSHHGHHCQKKRSEQASVRSSVEFPVF